MRWRRGDWIYPVWLIGGVAIIYCVAGLSLPLSPAIGLTLGLISEPLVRNVSERYRNDLLENGPQETVFLLAILQTCLVIANIWSDGYERTIDEQSGPIVAPFMLAMCFSQWSAHRKLTKQ